jgi:O-antigen/teichoic acid export membrane protein
MSDPPSAIELETAEYAATTEAADAVAVDGGQRSLPHMTSTLATTVAIQALGLVSGVIVARLLGVDGRGELAAVILWPSVLAYVGDLGGPLAYSFQSSNDSGSIPRLIGNVPFLVVAQWALLTVIGAPLIAFALSRYDTSVVTTSIAFLLAYVPLSFTVRYLNAINQGTGAFSKFNAVRLAVPVSYVAAVIVLAIVSLDSVATVAGAAIFSNAVALAVVLRGSRHRVETSLRRPRLNRPVLQASLGYGLRGHIGNLTPVDSMQLDLLLVTAVLGARDAGLYSVAVAAAMVVRTLGVAFGLVALPAVAAGPTPEAGLAAGTRIFRLCLVLSVVAAALVALTAPVLVPLLYGSGFRDAVPVLEILVCAMVLASLRQVLGDTLRGVGRPGRATISEVVSWLVAIAALGALFGPFQTVGAAVAAAASYAAAFALSLVFISKLGIGMGSFFRVTRDDLGAVGAELRRVAAGGSRLARGHAA